MIKAYLHNKWDTRFINLAKHVSTWSKDPSTQVGAVVTDGIDIVSVGFNGFPRGIADTPDRLNVKEIKYDLIIHAEVNAMDFAHRNLKGCTLYTWPLPPCIRCATQVIQRGITRVVAPVCTNPRWSESCFKSKCLMEEAGISVIEMDSEAS